MSNTQFKHAWPGPRQVGGDDGYQYCVFLYGGIYMNGLTQSEAYYYRRRIEAECREKAGDEPYQEPGPSLGQRLRERNFDATTYYRKTKQWIPGCTKCNPRTKGTKIAHQKSCRNVDSWRRKRYERKPSLAWTEIGEQK